MRRLRWAFLAVGFLLISTFASATFLQYTVRITFENATGATVRGLPASAATTSLSSLDGSITITAGGKNIHSNQTGTYGDALPGSDEYVISGDESQQLTINLSGQPAYSFGFSMYEPTSTGVIVGCNTTCVDSTFRVEFFSGASSLGFFDINAPNNVVSFYGWSSTIAFDKVTITETTGGIDNEYFGDLHLGNQVPEPASLLLLGSGLVAVLRRKR